MADYKVVLYRDREDRGNFPFHLTVWVGIIMAFMGLLMALSYSNSLFHGASGAMNRAKRMAVDEALISAGAITDASVGGILYQKYIMVSVYWFCAILVSTGIFIQFSLLILTKRLQSVS